MDPREPTNHHLISEPRCILSHSTPQSGSYISDAYDACNSHNEGSQSATAAISVYPKRTTTHDSLSLSSAAYLSINIYILSQHLPVFAVRDDGHPALFPSETPEFLFTYAGGDNGY